MPVLYEPVKERETELGTARSIKNNGSTLTEIKFNEPRTNADFVLRVNNEGEEAFGVLYYPEVRDANKFEKIKPFFERFGFAADPRDVYEFFQGNDLEGRLGDRSFVLTQGKRPHLDSLDYIIPGGMLGALVSPLATLLSGVAVNAIFSPEFLERLSGGQIYTLIGVTAVGGAAIGSILGSGIWDTKYGTESLLKEGREILDKYQEAFQIYSEYTTEFGISKRNADVYANAKSAMDHNFSRLKRLIMAVDSEGKDIKRGPGFYVLHRAKGEDRVIGNFRELLAA